MNVCTSKPWDKPKLAVSSSKYRRNVCLPSSKVYRQETQGAAFYLLTPRKSKKQARNIIILSREDSGIGLAPGRISDSSLEGNLTRDNSDSDLLSSVPYLTPILIPRIMAAIMTTWCEFQVENAKLFFPCPDDNRTVASTHVSVIEAGAIDPAWTAQHATRDEHFIQKLFSGAFSRTTSSRKSSSSTPILFFRLNYYTGGR